MRTLPEEAAGEPARQILAGIRHILGLPAHQLFYPALAVYPTFLELHWNLMRPVAESAPFFACAGRLRADGYTCAHNYLRIPDLCRPLERTRFSAGARQELAATIELFHYQNPLLLLLFSAQLQALEAPVGRAAPSRSPASHPAFQEPPVLVHEESASTSVRRRYEEIRRVLELPYLNAEFEAMARFPDFLEVYWQYLKTELSSPVYQECQYGVRTTAWNLVRELPGPLELSIEQLTESGMKQEDIASVARILELFVKNLAGQVLNVAIAKIALEGGNFVTSPSQSAGRGSERVA